MERTKIVCTIGPSSRSPEMIRAMIDAGMDVARLNFSHGVHDDHRASFRYVREAAQELGHHVAVMMDLQGPKIRTGRLLGGKPVLLAEDAEVVITTEDVDGTAGRLSTTYEHLARDVSEGDRILVADGTIELLVVDVVGEDVTCRVLHGGEVGEHKGINLPGVKVSAPCLTGKDIEDLAFGLELGVDYCALSFVRSPEDIDALNAEMDKVGRRVPIVAKIERPEAVDSLEGILDRAGAVMVARGDLGVEVPLADVPQIQKDIIHRCNHKGKPVITATQMLESMMTHPRPTRAEANDVANAIYDGTDCVMLSGETAAGEFPLEAVRIMSQIVDRADAALAGRPSDIEFEMGPFEQHRASEAFADAIGHAVAHMSESMPIRRIVCMTMSGYTAAMISRYRPDVPITAITLSEETLRKCALMWGVSAVQSVEVHTTDQMIKEVDEVLKKRDLAEDGDTVVIVAGAPLALGGRTNFLKLHTVGEKQEAAS